MAALITLALGGAHVSASQQFTADDVHERLEIASERARCVVAAETGRTYNPNLVGAQGEQGPVQLHPRGLLPSFRQWSNGADPRDPDAAISYLEMMIASGKGSNWTPILYGYC